MDNIVGNNFQLDEDKFSYKKPEFSVKFSVKTILLNPFNILKCNEIVRNVLAECAKTVTYLKKLLRYFIINIIIYYIE